MFPAVSSADLITTDRPSFSNSTYVVPPGTLQFESGVNRQKSQDELGTQTWLTETPLLVRAGIQSTFEARFGWNGYEWRRVGNEISEGPGDLGLGFKWRALENSGWTPSAASVVTVEFPSGAPSIRHVGYRPGLQVPFDWQLPADFSLTAMPGITYDTTDDGKRFWDPIFGVVANYGVTKNVQTFLEWALQQIAPADDGGTIQTLNVGAAWQFLPDWQIDGSVWHGLNRNSPVIFCTLGLSTRFSAWK